MIDTFKIEENSHRVSPQIDKRFSILCSEERPAGYCHDSEIHTENKDWMKDLSDRNVRITKLSIPGTHDTMAFYGGDAVQCQSLSLETQLNAGIRAIDIRCRHISDVFAIHHGCVYQNANFGDVLNTVARYLDEHPKETILMRVKEEYNEEKCNRTFEETFFEAYWLPYEKYFWHTSDKFGKYIPTLSEAEGKIVVLQNFTSNNSYGIMWDSDILAIQDDYHLDTNWDLYDKWEKVKAHLTLANNSSDDKLYINFLSGSGGSFPYFVASGQSSPGTNDPRLLTGRTTPGWANSWPDFPRIGCFLGICSIAFEGTNILSAERIGKNNTFNSKVGIIMCDFPGKDLIESIISLN